MKLVPLVSILAAVATTAVLGVSVASAHPVPGQRQNQFGHVEMPEHYTFDTSAQGPPRLIDVLAKEKSATIAMDAIMQSESLVRAISGDSTGFKNGLTLLLPTNEAFRQAGPRPENLELVMQRHFIPQVVSLKSMASGVTVASYEDAAVLRFWSEDGIVNVQADSREKAQVSGAGVQAGTGTYFLVNQLFT